MGRLLTRHGVRGRAGQALAFHARQRSKSIRTGTSALFRTHTFAEGDNPIDTDVSFPARVGDLTVAFELSLDDFVPTGVLFELGSSTTGLALYVTNLGALGFVVGDAGDDGVSLVVAGAFGALQNYKVVAAVRPGSGEARLWIDGRLRARGTAVNGALPNGWADTDDGAVADIAGTVSSRVPGPQAVTLSDVSIVGPVSVFLNQVPRHFSESIW